MNILYYHVHDQGRYVEPYGYPVNTPRLGSVAEEGVLFRNAFCAAPSCSPSRAALLTGRYPHQVGMYGLTNEGWLLSDYDQHLRKTLSDAGFETVLAGTHHVTDHTEEGLTRLGYDRVLIEEDESDLAEYRTQAAIEYLREFAACDREGNVRDGSRENTRSPFFLALGYDITHHSKWKRSFVHSFSRFGPLDSRHVRPVPGQPDTPATRREAALQRRASEFQDYQLGRILDELDRLSLREDTLLIYTSDHGPGIPGAKLNLSDAGTAVSLVMSGPGIGDSTATRGSVVDGLVHHVDVFPTICELCGIDPPPWLEGRSLLPLVRGEIPRIHDAVFSEQSYHGSKRPLRSVRTERYRYVRRIGEGRMTVADYIADTGEAKELYRESGAAEREIPQEMLYDVVFDPDERHNLIDEPGYGDVADDLRRRLDEWMRATDDPALAGDVPPQPERPAWATERGSEKAAWGRYWSEAAARLGVGR